MIESLRDEIRLLRGSLESGRSTPATRPLGRRDIAGENSFAETSSGPENRLITLVELPSEWPSPPRLRRERWIRRLGRAATDALFIFIILVGLFLLLPYETAPTPSASSEVPSRTSARATAASHTPTRSSPPAERLYRKSPEPTLGAVPEPRTDDRENARDRERITAEIEKQISAWAAAWARRDVGAYLDSYSTSFKPANGSSRQAWIRSRRSRVGAEHPRSVELSQITVKIDGERAEARFVQAYTSPTYRDRVPKVLVLRLEKERWKILEERTRQSS